MTCSLTTAPARSKSNVGAGRVCIEVLARPTWQLSSLEEDRRRYLGDREE
jgi:hypothetical protein